jgi:TPR repeat protein
MYSGVRSAICLAVILTMPTAAFSDAPIDPQKLYAQAKAGDVEAMCELSNLLYNGSVVKQDLQASYKWAEAGAKLDAAQCINNLGIHLFDGKIVQKDERRAFALFSAAANKDYAIAQRNLAIIYIEGRAGQARNPSMAKYWFSRAAAQGDAASQEQLGYLLLHDDDGVKADHSAAFDWFIAAAEQDLPYSQWVVGNMLAVGDGTSKDEREAVRWWIKSASNGFAPAQLSAGIALMNGAGVHRDAEYGIHWLEKVGTRLDARTKDLGGAAQAVLAEVFEKGIGGVRPDPYRAREHWKKAADLGVDGAAEALAAIDKAILSADASNSPTADEALAGLALLGVLGALASGGTSDSDSECDLPSYTQNWSQAAKDYECYQRGATERFNEEQDRMRKQNQWELECYGLGSCF